MLTELWYSLTSFRPKLPEFLGKYLKMATSDSTVGSGVYALGIPVKVLDPQHKIASCVSRQDEESFIDVSNENLRKFVANLQPHWRDVPVVTLCVLGSDDGSTQKLLTNWLIHYFQSSKPRTFARNLENQLDYVGDLSNMDNVQGSGQGLYLWPKSGFHDGQIYVVLYANSERIEVLDVLSALACSIVITYKQSQKDRILASIKRAFSANAITKTPKFVDVNRSYQKLSAYKNGETGLLREAWTLFFDAIEKESLHPQIFADSKLTPNSFELFVEGIVSILNANQPNNKDLFVSKKLKALAPGPTEKTENQKKEENTTSKPIPQDSHKVEKPTNTKTPQDIYEVLQKWVANRLNISSVDNILKLLEDEVVKADPKLQADITALHNIINRLNEDLLKMHDNYVCFHGARDQQQMMRFQNSASDASLGSLQTIKFTHTNCTVIFDAAKQRLLSRYQIDDKKIQEKETELTNEIVEIVQNEYEKKLMEYYTLPKLTKEQFQQVHQRMLGYCVSLIGKSMNYGGRLNNVVKESTKTATTKMDEHFTRICENVEFKPVRSPPPVPPRKNVNPPNPLFSYHKLIKEALSKYNGSMSPDFKQENDRITQQVLANTTGSDRDELAIRLCTYLSYLDELHEQSQGQGQTHANNENPSTIAMLITSRWVWHAVNTKRLPYQLLTSQNEKGSSTFGFPAEIALQNNQLLYGHSVKKTEGQLQGRIINFICDDKINRDTAQIMITKFFKKIKFEQGYIANENIEGLFLILPSWLGIKDRNLLRKCGQAAEFQRLMFLTESSVSAYYTMWKVPKANKPYVLAVAAAEDAIRLEIFRQENAGVQLVAVAYELWPIANSKYNIGVEKRPVWNKPFSGSSIPKKNLEVVHATYGRVLNQVVGHERELLTHYVLLSETTKWVDDLDKYFQTKAGLTKAENIDKGETFIEVFLHFASNPQTIKTFVETLSTIPTQVNLVKNSMSESPSNANQNLSKSDGGNALLKKCKSIEQQLEAGTVDVTNLTKKIILKAVQRGKEAARQNMAGGQEEAHVNEIFEKYKFK